MCAAIKADRRSDVWNGSQAILDAQYLMLPHGVAGFLRRLSKENILSADYGLVFEIILEHKHDRENPFPSQEVLAKKAGISVDAVGQAIAHLTACGLIRKVKKPKGKGVSYDIQPFIEKFERFLAQYTKENGYKVDVRALFTVEELAAVEELKTKKRKHKGNKASKNAPVVHTDEERRLKALEERIQKEKEELKKLQEERQKQDQQAGDGQPEAPASPGVPPAPVWTRPEEIPDEIYAGLDNKIVRVLRRNLITDHRKIDIVKELYEEFRGYISFDRFLDKLESSLRKYKYDFRRYFIKSLKNAVEEEEAEFYETFQSREMSDDEWEQFMREVRIRFEEGKEKARQLGKASGIDW
jgi:DNA-binding transcriptional regulator YhcF (GntR family)